MMWMLLIQVNEFSCRWALQASIHWVRQHMIVHRRTRLHCQTMLRLMSGQRVCVVHRLIHHIIRPQVVRLMVHARHLRGMMIHRWRRLDCILLMILISNRLLLNRRRINHVGHRSVLPLFLVLESKAKTQCNVSIYTIY